MWDLYKKHSLLNEDEDDDHDEAHSTAGLAPFSSTHEAEGWPPEDTIDFHGELVIKAAAEYLGAELLHH